MRPAATPRCQHPEPASPVLADAPLPAQALRPSVPERLQEPAERQVAGGDLQPRVLQAAARQVSVGAERSGSGLSEIDAQAAGR